MELIDILDENKNITGEIKTKDEVHSRGLWHQTVHVWFINSNNEILLQRRSKMKKAYPGMWDISVAGHISIGEDSLRAIFREVKEEIGVDLEESSLKFIGTIKREKVLNNNTYFDNEFNDIYLVKRDLEINKLNLQEEEVAEIQWVKISEFKKWVEEKKSDLVPHEEECELLFRFI